MRSPSLTRLFNRRPRLSDEPSHRWPPLPDDMELEGASIWLRWPHLSDAEAVFQYASDENVSAFMDWRIHRNIEESKRFLSLLEQSRRQSREAAFGIIEKESNQFIGICSLVSQRKVSVAELGYALRRSAWGNGYMTEAVSLVTRWAFSSLPLEEIFADAHPDNFASQRVLEKTGFLREAAPVSRTIKGVRSPHHHYRLHSPRSP